MGVLENIREQYPTLSFLVDHPEIGPLLRDAVDPNKGFSPQTFQAKLYQTNWWKSQSNTQREWLIKSQTDPGSANAERKTGWNELDAMAKRMGVSLTPAQVKWLTETALANGQSLDSVEVKRGIMKLWRGTDYGKGQVGVDAQSIRALAQSEYFRPMSSNEAHELARRVATGDDTLESIKTRLQSQAAERFPHLRQRISEGLTPAQIVEPYRQIVAEELEYGDISEVNVMTDPKWRRLLGIRQSDGKMRMMTESEVMLAARQQPRWWSTSRGKEADAGMASTLMNVFGARKSLGG